MKSFNESIGIVTWTSVVTNSITMCGFLAFAISIHNLNLIKLKILSILFAAGNASFITTNCLQYAYYHHHSTNDPLHRNLIALFYNLTFLFLTMAVFIFSMNYWNLSWKMKYTIIGK
jgi:hypothetical protein